MQDYKEDIDLYVKHGCNPGGFLTAVLENDLKEAFGRADIINRDRLFEIVSYCYNSIPTICWGSKSAVKEWIKRNNEKK